jgi:hypothetical protein
MQCYNINKKDTMLSTCRKLVYELFTDVSTLFTGQVYTKQAFCGKNVDKYGKQALKSLISG